MEEKDSPLEKMAVYLMDEQGRYDDPAWMEAREVVAFVTSQCRNYHEIRVCDGGDNLCMHVIDGRMLYPDRNTIAAYWQKRKHEDN